MYIGWGEGGVNNLSSNILGGGGGEGGANNLSSTDETKIVSRLILSHKILHAYLNTNCSEFPSPCNNTMLSLKIHM